MTLTPKPRSVVPWVYLAMPLILRKILGQIPRVHPLGRVIDTDEQCAARKLRRRRKDRARIVVFPDGETELGALQGLAPG